MYTKFYLNIWFKFLILNILQFLHFNLIKNRNNITMNIYFGYMRWLSHIGIKSSIVMSHALV